MLNGCQNKSQEWKPDDTHMAMLCGALLASVSIIALSFQTVMRYFSVALLYYASQSRLHSNAMNLEVSV